MKGIMKKVTAIFMAMVMVLSCVVVGGTTAKAADYYFNPEEYDMRYILSNYQIYVKGNLTTTNSGHQVGSIAVGGSAYLSNTFGNASIAPSYIYHVATYFNTNDYYSELKDSPYADLHNLYVYYTEIEQGINLNSHPTIFEQKDSYINMGAAFSAIEKQSQQMAQMGEEVHVSSDGYIYLDVSNKNAEHTYIISEDDFLKAKAICFKGTNNDLSAFRNKEYPITISVKGLDDTDVNVEFNQEGMVDAPVIGIYWDTNPSETEDTYTSLANALKKLDGAEGYNSNYQVAPEGTNVLFNFPEVTKTLHANLLSGQLVAPKAHVSIGGGNYEGCFIGASAYVDAEGHFYPYYEMGTAIADAPLKPYISGGDFLITVQDAPNATEETVIDLAKALRHATVGAPGDADDVAVDNLSDLKQKSEPGKVPVTLVDGSTETKKAPSKEVVATVVDKKSTSNYWNNTQNEFIQLGANDFEMSKKQAQAYSSNKNGDAEKALVKALANAVALQDGNAVAQSDISIISDNIQPVSGRTYQVTFGYKNAQVMVNVTVKDDGPTDNVGNPTDIPSVNLTANNFTVNGGSATLTEEAFITKAEVVAKNNDGSSRQDIKVDAQDLANLNDKIKNAVDGDCPVKVTSGGVTTTVTVTVISGYPFISADDFIVKVEETTTADAAKVKDWSNAGRIPEAGQAADAEKVDVANLNDLRNQNEAGVVDVVLKDNTSDVQKAVDRTVVATVVDEKETAVVDGAEIVIGANNFNISKAQAKAVVDNAPSKDATEAMIKILANAVATDDGDAVKPEDITVDASAIRAEENTYDVIFTYKGQSVTVKATVKDDGPTDKATDPTDVPAINLTANDFSVEAKSSAFTEDTFKTAANVEGNYNTGASIPNANIDVDDADLTALNQKIADGVPGEYEVDVTTGGVTTTVTVTVTEKYPKVEANDFIISVEDAKDADADDIKDLSDTKRYESPSDETAGADKGTENVTVPSGEVDELNGMTEPGSVEITIKDENTDPADNQTVKATVVDETTTSQDGKIVIGANNYNISIQQAEAIVDSLVAPNAKPDKAATDLMNKILANAVATDEGTAVDRNNIAVDASDIDAVPGTYQVTFTYKGESVTVDVTVKDDGSTDGADDPTRVPGINLTANDFTVVGGSSALTPQDFVNLANVEANNNDGSKRNDIEVNAADLAVLNQKIAAAVNDQYVVEVMSGGVTTKVTVTITKPETYPKVNANDFIVDVDDVKNLTPEDVKDLSDTNRYTTPEEENNGQDNGSDKVTVPDITDLTGRTEPGSVDLTLEDGNQNPAEDKPVTAIVVDETTTSRDGKIVIGANNFNVTIEQAEAIQKNPTSNAVKTMVKTLANAVATDDGEMVAKKDIDIEDVTVIKAENGTYDVTFTYGGESVTVEATVKDAGAGDGSSNPTKVPDVNLTGNDFAVEAGSDPLTEEAFKDVPNADVEANYNDGSSVPEDKVKVNPEDLEKLNDAIKNGETGPVEVEVSVDDKTATITVTVADEKTVDNGNKETVAANNFEIKLSEYDTVVDSKDELVKRAEAFAYNTETRADVEIAKATVKDPKKEAGTYDVTFTTQKGSSVTVKMTVVDDTTAGEETYPKLDADDFIVDVDDLKDLTPEDVKDLSDTNRYTTPEEENNGQDNGSDKVTVPDITDLTGRTEPGSVDLTLKDGNQDPAEDKPVTAIVVDETTTSQDGKIVIGANNFNVTIEQAEAIQKNPTSDAVLTMVKTLANAVATDEGEKVAQKDIAVEDVTVIKAENGTYDVTFTYGGESVTVEATVKDAGAGDGSNDPTKVPDVNLTGNDFAVEAGSDPLTEEAFKDVPNADVEANYNDGSSVPEDKVKVNPEDLEKLNDAIKNGETGPVEVEVSVDDKTATITVTVADEKTVDNGNKETVAANNFEIKLSEYDTIVDSKDELVKRAEAFAYNTDTRADVEIAKATVKDPKKEVGTYDVTFVTEKGSSVTVKMTAVDDTTAGEETYPKLDANDFIVDVDDLKDLTPEDVKDLSDTNRYTTPEEENNGQDNGSDKVTIPDITDLTGRTEPGSVDLTLKDGNQDPAEDKPVTAIVVDETTTSQDGKIVIGANNFNVTIEQAEAIQSNPKNEAVLTMVKTLANAVATDEGEKVAQKDIAIKDVTVIKPENGTYDVTFTYGGESVTVEATVKDAGAGDGSNDPTKVPDVNLTGNDFAVEAGSDPLTEEAFKDVPNADVEANYNDGSSVPEDKVKVNPEDLEKLNDAIKNGETGPVDVEVVVDDKTTVITVTVTDEKAVDNGNKETVAANNFEIKLSEYNTVVDSKDELVKRAEAFAYDTETRADVEIAKATVKDPKKEAGSYDVTFVTEKGSAVTVKMTVVADDAGITAKDFSVEAGSDPLTPEEFVKKAEVVAKKSDGTPITSVTVDPTDLATLNKAIQDGKEGPQTVKVTADGKTATVTVTVTKGDDIKGQDKIYELSNPKDVPQTLAQGRTVKNVNVDGKDIPASAYEVSGNEMKIKSSVFKDKKEGVYPVVITYKDGSKHTFNVTVVPYNKETVVTKVPIFHMQKDLGLGKKFKINLVGMTKYSIKKFKTSNKRIATVDKNGVIKGKKIGKCKITATIIQNGSYYTVKIDLHVKKSMKMYNLKKKALQKKEGNLPEFNVYKRVVKGKKTKMKFTNIAKNAKITYTSSNKKVATVSKKGVIKGKKKGFTVVTAKIEQSGHTYYTKLIVRVDDGTTNKDLKKYLK